MWQVSLAELPLHETGRMLYANRVESCCWEQRCRARNSEDELEQKERKVKVRRSANGYGSRT